MGLFDLFRPQKSEQEKLTDEWKKVLFPGGEQEILFKAKTVLTLSNGKLTVEESSWLCFVLKLQLRMAVMSFNGRKNKGLAAENVLVETITTSKGKLSPIEAGVIAYYGFFDIIEPGIDTAYKLKSHLAILFGSDTSGTDADEIPTGLGEFGFDPTNPIPVRGTLSNEIYLRELRTEDGRAVEFDRNGSLAVPNIEGNIDEYALSQQGRPLCNLYISPYNQKISEKPPGNFILVSRS